MQPSQETGGRIKGLGEGPAKEAAKAQLPCPGFAAGHMDGELP